jgi:vacuolar protein-sorting-associated protein 4
MAINDTIIHKGSMKFDDVAGLLEAKQALKEAIIMPLQYPQLFTGYIIQNQQTLGCSHFKIT